MSQLSKIPSKNLLSNIRLIVLDVDGVLTNGAITYADNNTELKTFNAKDGFGITLGRYAGLKFGILTGRTSKIVERRAFELKIDFYQSGQFYKLPALEKMCQNYEMDEILYIGDDILDLACKPVVGIFACPKDAALRIQKSADWILSKKGGKGAVREAIDTILSAQKVLTSCEDYFISGQKTKGATG